MVLLFQSEDDRSVQRGLFGTIMLTQASQAEELNQESNMDSIGKGFLAFATDTHK